MTAEGLMELKGIDVLSHKDVTKGVALEWYNALNEDWLPVDNTKDLPYDKEVYFEILENYILPTLPLHELLKIRNII